MNKKLKKAFTLSEVLITLTILGIIAAITIPTLSAAAKKHSYSVAVRKFHSNLSNAVANYMAVHDYTTLSSSPMEQEDDEDAAQEAVNQFIRDNFKVTKECNKNNEDECLATKYCWLEGQCQNNWNPLRIDETGAGMQLADGSVVSIGTRGDRPLEVKIDINGKKGPNVAGYDVWSMNIYQDGTVNSLSTLNGKSEPRYYAENGNNDPKYCFSEQYGGQCFSRLKENDWVIDW